MLSVPPDLMISFVNLLVRRKIDARYHHQYKKWLRYYLDFCGKYGFDPKERQSFPPFCEKLQSKRQPPAFLEQAFEAVSLRYELLLTDTSNLQGLVKPGGKAQTLPETKGQHGIQSTLDERNRVSERPGGDSETKNSVHSGSRPVAEYASPHKPGPAKQGPISKPVSKSRPVHAEISAESSGASTRTRQMNQPGSEGNPHRTSKKNDTGLPEVRLTNASWVKVYDELVSAIKVRHYSPKTLIAYRNWTSKFQTFTRSKDPRLLETKDVKHFLTDLAVSHNVAASTQNQAFNALLFRFFGKMDPFEKKKQLKGKLYSYPTNTCFAS